MNTQKYRPDIDGLRALAVSLVVIFHAGISVLPGGFVGVDVFFVISGFLITSKVHEEVLAGSFSLAGFYRSRIRRLMPALFFMMFAVLLISLLLLLPHEIISFSKSLLAATLSVSNIFFWRENGGYFDGGAQDIPLLHTWSLSVEEQFYLLWPLFLILASRYLSFWKTIFIGVVIFLGSLLLSEWVSYITFGAAYYLLPTRAFELLAGALLALSWKRVPIAPKYLNDILSIIGIVLIVISAFYLSESDQFPGFNALYVTVGSVILIITGKGNAGVINKLLSLKSFVSLGLISYSLYLWHWPIIVFVRYIGIELNIFVSMMLISSSVIVGWFSWKFIEKPFRYNSDPKFKRTFLYLFVLPALLISLISVVIISTNGLPSRFSSDVLLMDKALSSEPNKVRGDCHSPARNSEVHPSINCTFGETENPDARAFMFGDSHANHFTGFIDVLAQSANIEVQDYTLDACLPIFDLYYGKNLYYAKNCNERNNLAMAHIKNNSFDYVVLSGEWPTENSFRYFYKNTMQLESSEALKNHIKNKLVLTISTIIKSGAIPVIIRDNVAGGFKSPKCSVIRSRFQNDRICESATEYAASRLLFMNEIIDQVKSIFPRLLIIDPSLIMCDKNQCFTELGDIPLYRDRLHLNNDGARYVGNMYLEQLGNPFEASN